MFSLIYETFSLLLDILVNFTFFQIFFSILSQQTPCSTWTIKAQLHNSFISYKTLRSSFCHYLSVCHIIAKKQVMIHLYSLVQTLNSAIIMPFLSLDLKINTTSMTSSHINQLFYMMLSKLYLVLKTSHHLLFSMTRISLKILTKNAIK